jgi:16S rRNA (guanine527-N7)-methyltransferase
VLAAPFLLSTMPALDEFISALRSNQEAFGLSLDNSALERLGAHYDLVREHNHVLHLMGPSSPEEFAVRHVLESLTLLEELSRGAKLADVGPGAGFPSLPCLLVRDDLRGMLIESKEKKAEFLRTAIDALGLIDRVSLVNKQFAESVLANATHVTCRALDRFTDHLPRLVKWADKRRLLLFGGDNLAEALRNNGVSFKAEKMPLSDRRYLFVSAPK